MKKYLVKVLLLIVTVWFFGYMHQPDSVSRADDPVNRPSDSELALTPAHIVVNKVLVKTTAYSNDFYSINVARWRDGRTATNKLARRGIIAADWDVFPPGTRIYIPGYGEGVVEDKGGAVRGKHLDLFLDTRNEALQWGVKRIEVYVLELGKRTQPAKEHPPFPKPKHATSFPLG
jgi:3D (Asp-Asp-Asp) domain-containing protein